MRNTYNTNTFNLKMSPISVLNAFFFHFLISVFCVHVAFIRMSIVRAGMESSSAVVFYYKDGKKNKKLQKSTTYRRS